MRRVVVVAVMLCAACGDKIEPVPVEDARPVVGDTFTVPIGAACDATVTIFCARGLGSCLDAVCRRRCNSGAPRCDAGELAHHDTIAGGADRCVCIPE